MIGRQAGWRAHAACRGRVDLDWFDPSPAEAVECRSLCAGCPVLDQCRAEALTSGEAWGIWGGLDADERTLLAEQTGQAPPAVLPTHGTNSRYAKHGCRCQSCRAAHTDYERARRDRKQARGAGPWARPVVLAEAVRVGRGWAGAGQYLLPLPGIPEPQQAEPVEVLASAA